MPLRSNSLPFGSSVRFGNANSYSASWPSRNAPADDGSCSQNVAVMVLNAFNIPIVGAHPPRGNLCGLDINNMSAADAIKLSLAENIAIGKLYELYMNEYGQAYFQEVYPNAKTVTLDIRMCVPSSSITSVVDGVIVRGYDKPPVRTFKQFYEVISANTGSLNPQTVPNGQAYHSLDVLLNPSYCHGTHFTKEARISYPDPVLKTSYMDGVDNLYELNAFESLVGYVIDFDGEADPDVKYSFSDTSLFDIILNFGNASLGLEGICTADGGEDTVAYSKKSATVGPFNKTDKYGDNYPTLNSVSQMTCSGYKIKNIIDYTAGVGGGVVVHVEPSKDVFSLSAGTNWYWELNANSSADVHIYYPTGDPGEDINTIATLLAWPTLILIKDGYGYDANNLPTSQVSIGTAVPNLGGTPGIIADKIVATVEIDRPSVTVQHIGGQALTYARQLTVKYQPIIVVDEPPPIAYTFGGGAQLVDHTLDLIDSDPATVEINPTVRTGSLAWLQSVAQGNIVDVSLPFLSEDDCRGFADELYNMYNESITTYSLVCGPTSEPELGAKVGGLEGRINNITYSFQDSSSYTINVTVGPTIMNVGSWSNNLWQKRTEDVSREGIIVWTAGNGVDYLVRVRGLGVYPAVNMTLNAYAPGEKVQVTIHNNPVES
jgi:hypothetical protein